MRLWSCNNQFVCDEYKGRGDNLPAGIRDIAGWALIIGFLLTLAAWRLDWIGNVVNSILAIVFLTGAVVALLAYPISRLLHRNEPEMYYLWAKYQKEKF